MSLNPPQDVNQDRKKGPGGLTVLGILCYIKNRLTWKSCFIIKLREELGSQVQEG